MFELKILYISINSIWVITSLRSLTSLLSFCLVYLSKGESGVLKSPTISVWSLMCGLSFSSISFTYVGGLVLGAINIQN